MVLFTPQSRSCVLKGTECSRRCGFDGMSGPCCRAKVGNRFSAGFMSFPIVPVHMGQNRFPPEVLLIFPCVSCLHPHLNPASNRLETSNVSGVIKSRQLDQHCRLKAVSSRSITFEDTCVKNKPELTDPHSSRLVYTYF